MPSMTTTDQIKQRLASLLNDAYPLGIPTHTAIRDALAVIEQQEQQIAQRQDLTGEYVKGNEAYVKQLESQLREREAQCAAYRSLIIDSVYDINGHIIEWPSQAKWFSVISATDAGRDLLERLQKAEAERDDYRTLASCKDETATKGSAVQLKRCPFCGSSRVVVRFYNQPSVVCEDCLCMGPAASRLTKENKDDCFKEATLRWNKRVDYRITLAEQRKRNENPT